MQDQTFHVTGPVRLDVRIPHADLTVATGAADSASVSFGDGRHADDVTVTCERRGETDVLTVSAKQSGLFRSRRPISVAVRVPDGSAVGVTTAAGGIVCTGPLGAVRVETASAGVRIPEATSADVVGVSGEVYVGRVAGEASLKTVSGAIEVDDVRGRLVLRTVSGRIRVRGAGGDVEARSVSGDVQLQRLEQGVVRLDSASGQVRSDLGASDDGPSDGRPVLELRGRTVSGAVRVGPVEA
jgi:hypothetical protein